MKSFVRSKRIRYLCIAVSLVTLMMLLIPAGNRGIVENHIYLLNPLASDSSTNLPDIPAMVQTTSSANQSVLNSLHEIAASKKPMDMGLQIGYLTTSASPPLAELNAIFQKFPNQPSVCSAVLLWAMDYDQGKNPDIMEFTIKVASQGERVDPDNAFFPFILANALYLHHDNKKGWLAFKRIEKCKKWDTYVNDAVRDNAKLVRMGYGYQSSLGRYSDVINIQNSAYYFSFGLPGLMKRSRQQEIKLALKTSQNGYGHKEIAIQTLQERQIWSHLLGLVIQNPSSYGADRWGMATIYIAGCIGTQRYRNWLLQMPKSLTNDQRMQWILDKFATYTRSHPSGTGSRYTSKNVSVFLREMKMEEIRDKRMAYLPALCLWWAIGAVTLALLLWIVLLSGLSYLFHPSGRLFSAKSGWASAGSIYLLSGIVLDEIGVFMHFDMRYVILLGICAVIFALIGIFCDTWVWRGIWIGGLINIQEMLYTPKIKIQNLFMWWWVIVIVSCIVAIILHYVRHRRKEKDAPTQKVSVMHYLWRLVLSALHGVYVFVVSMLVSALIFGFLYISCYTLTALIFTTLLNPHHLDVLYLWSDTFSNLY